MIMLKIVLGALYVEKSESAARILGAIDNSESESDLIPAEPMTRLYGERAEAHVRRVLGDSAFESLFAEGQKLSLDDALDLALTTVEEM
jgi:hypothetical protein